MDTPETVPASEFTRNFGRYRMRAQREAVAVSSHGQITGYFVGPDDEEFRRFRESRRSFATVELPEEKSKRSGPRAWIQTRASRQAARSQIAEAHADPQVRQPGLVISDAYLWHHEHQAGLEEGQKADRVSLRASR